MLSEIDIDELELIRDDIKIISKLGEGEFGEVFKGIWRGELSVAVKRCRQKMDFLGLRREANALHKLRHRHIVQLLGICTQPRDEPFLVILEYMAKGDLLRWLKNESRRLSIRKHINILAQIADAMQYLEAKNVIHRDLRCVNVLVGEDETIKLSDFGLARPLEDQKVYNSDTQFPIRWTAPEAAYEPHNYSVKSDVWSFGVLMYEVLTNGGVPYEDIRVDEIHRRIVAGLRLPNPNPNDSTCCGLYEWMLKCWNLERSCRPMFLELYQMLECAQERLEQTKAHVSNA
ncbi:hypothetical protein EG68_00122 [Paragonimus skrjabini miyazakii]|uniref:Protein kinase domain-containing protein n=1 Tax=Paragonimus skrjabini miyazakii TaxID=59628 RepID=A0A8S9ZAT9_9TREM|nr:hypothetical protein EG68_00122 [Paragonimus skrjabini miyazakii]